VASVLGPHLRYLGWFSGLLVDVCSCFITIGILVEGTRGNIPGWAAFEELFCCQRGFRGLKLD
jgi:hypothetical protein